MRKNIYSITILISIFIAGNLSAQNYWKPTGAIKGGRVFKVAAAPNGNIYAAGSYGGVFRSTDNGASWEQTNNGLNYLQIRTIKCGPGNLVYTGTSRGIYRSTDNGDDWQLIQNNSCNCISIDSNGTVYAAQFNNQISVSADSGDNWTRLHNGIDTTSIYFVRYTANGILIGVDYYKGIFRSTDKGATWHASDNGYTITDGPSGIFSDKNGNIFLSTYFGGIYESSDNGKDWSKINGDITNKYILDVAVNSAGDIFAATFGDVFKSTNGGSNWNLLNSGTYSRSLQCVVVDKSDNILCGTYYDGVTRSTDGGATWNILNNGLYFTTIESLVKDSSGNIYAAVTGKGIYESTDNGTTWDSVQIKDDEYKVSILDIAALPAGGLIASATFGGTYITKDYVNWQPFTRPFTGNYIFRTVAASSRGYLYGGTPNGKIYRSPDSVDNWTDITDTLHCSYIYKIGVSPEGEVFAISDSGVFRSSDNGDSWMNVNGIPRSYNFSIAFASDGDIYIGGGDDGGGVYRSTDNGADWTNSKTGLTNTYVSALAFHRDTIYAGTYNGVFSSADSGKTWIQLKGGLASSYINSLVYTDSGHLLAGTKGSGIFKSTNEITTGLQVSSKMPNTFTLYQNYPNPFNPSTTIRYSINSESKVILTIFNALGQKIKRLVNSTQSPGYHEVQFNASGLASGVYFYKLSVESSGGGIKASRVKKLLLLK